MPGLIYSEASGQEPLTILCIYQDNSPPPSVACEWLCVSLWLRQRQVQQQTSYFYTKRLWFGLKLTVSVIMAWHGQIWLMSVWFTRYYHWSIISHSLKNRALDNKIRDPRRFHNRIIFFEVIQLLICIYTKLCTLLKIDSAQEKLGSFDLRSTSHHYYSGKQFSQLQYKKLLM